MAFFRNPATKQYEADVKDATVGRVHLSLRTTNARLAARRYVALVALVRQATDPLVGEVLRQVRRQRIKIDAVQTCHESGRPFAQLLADQQWPTLGVATEQYLAWLDAHPHRSHGTRRQAVHYLEDAIAYFGADVRVDQIRQDSEQPEDRTISGWRTALAGEPRNLSPKSLFLALARVGALYHWLQAREQRRAVEGNRAARTLHVPIDTELLAKPRARRVRFLDASEAERVLAATPPRFKAPVALGLMAGLRVGEVLHLTPADLDLDLGFIHIGEKPAPFLPGGRWKPKTRTSTRDVPIEPQLTPYLALHLATVSNGEWFLPSTQVKHRCTSEPTFWKHFDRIVRDAGLVAGRTAADGVTFHTLRHSFASWLVMEGVDLYTVSQLLGHANIDEVQETYAHLSPDHRLRAVQRLSRHFTLPTVDEEAAWAVAPADAPKGLEASV